MNGRYAREWLEQQAAAGIVRVDETGGVRHFSLSPAHTEVLTDPDSVAYAAPFARMLVGRASRLPELLEAYMTGGGVGVGGVRLGRARRAGRREPAVVSVTARRRAHVRARRP